MQSLQFGDQSDLVPTTVKGLFERAGISSTFYSALAGMPTLQPTGSTEAALLVLHYLQAQGYRRSRASFQKYACHPFHQGGTGADAPALLVTCFNWLLRRRSTTYVVTRVASEVDARRADREAKQVLDPALQLIADTQSIKPLEAVIAEYATLKERDLCLQRLRADNTLVGQLLDVIDAAASRPSSVSTHRAARLTSGTEQAPSKQLAAPGAARRPATAALDAATAGPPSAAAQNASLSASLCEAAVSAQPVTTAQPSSRVREGHIVAPQVQCSPLGGRGRKGTPRKRRRQETGSLLTPRPAGARCCAVLKGIPHISTFPAEWCSHCSGAYLQALWTLGPIQLRC